MRMNSLFTQTGFKLTNSPTRNSVFSSVSIAVLLSILSSPAFANRPSMGEEPETIPETINEPAEPIEEARPSSVDLMMQQDNRQTGDVVQLPAKEIQPGETIKIKLLDYPRRGMTMDKVQNEYGQPIAISDSVGKPPITRWTYRDRVVYFEYSSVLHVVAR